MSKNDGSWRKYMPHPKEKDDFDRETAWDMIGILTLLIIIETGIIIVLLLYIFIILL